MEANLQSGSQPSVQHPKTLDSLALLKSEGTAKTAAIFTRIWIFWVCFICFAACLQTIILIGHIFGFLVGSFCARLYVDVGSVDLGKCVISLFDLVGF